MEVANKITQHIRSFMPRNRITPAQRRALTENWARFGTEINNDRLDLSRIFGRDATVVLEIGCGNGDLLTQMAAGAPQRNFLGVEVYRSGVGALLQKALKLSLNNLHIICDDAIKVINRIEDDSISEAIIMFPDPWPKKRHRKRRLIQADFINMLTPKIKTHGLLYLATDSESYATQMRAAVEAVKKYRHLPPEQIVLPKTAFEKRACAAGRPVFNLLYQVVRAS